jgi:flagellar basal-body rod protein FlgC
MADDGSDFARSMSIATSGLRAQAGRMRVISENIANADHGADRRRRTLSPQGADIFSALDRTLDARVVTLGKVKTDQSSFRVKQSRPIRRRTRPATSNIRTSIRWSK